MVRHPTILAALLLATSLIGCDKGPSSAASGAPATQPSAALASYENPYPNYKPSTSLAAEFAVKADICSEIHRTTLRGKVIFSGPIPTPKPLNNQPCHPGAKPIYDETIVVNPDKTLRNAVVYLTGVTPSSVNTIGRAILDQSDCRYTPHVVAVQTGQTLRVTSSDPTLHNVHVLADANPSVNVAMTGAGQFHDLVFKAPEFLRTKCDVHPWMTAYVAVIDNPFFAVTRDDGTFEIKNAPAGNYTLACWHERLGDLKQQVTIPQDGTTEVTFTYKEP